ncbi:uncharacterized protein LOC122315219 [Carya illinoinensis]|uniref:uncharacterized protein LOC122315219 n=1 Tax=Carya illinoinensis TaxID=32201 RepID=UPI001C71F69C|nr:uncharacterized protein LOC122315219 [Carya illinoinensis]
MSWYGRSLFGGGSRTAGGVASVANAKELSKASYASESNQVSRPVMIDAEGRKMPVIVCTSNQSEQSYLVETIEPIRTPLVSEYTHGSPPKADPVKNYGNGYSPPTKAEPVEDYVRDDDNQRRHSSPARDRPREVEVFLNKVQTEAMRRPSRSAWAPATPRNDTKLDTPTSDIATAMENLKEGARGLSVTNVPPQSRYNIPLSTGPKRDTYSDTIDSSVRRYGNLNISSRPRTTGDTYDSREAAKRYGGASIA